MSRRTKNATALKNAEAIDLSKDSFQLKAGGTARIKAREVLPDKRKASILETHDISFRCASSNG